MGWKGFGYFGKKSGGFWRSEGKCRRLKSVCKGWESFKGQCILGFWLFGPNTKFWLVCKFIGWSSLISIHCKAHLARISRLQGFQLPPCSLLVLLFLLVLALVFIRWLGFLGSEFLNQVLDVFESLLLLLCAHVQLVDLLNDEGLNLLLHGWGLLLDDLLCLPGLLLDQSTVLPS